MSSFSFSRVPFLALFAFVAVALGGADGCSSDPQVEGAKLYINNQEYDRALENLDESLATDPDNVEALVLKAEVLRLKAEEEGMKPEAMTYLEQITPLLDRAATLAPDDQSVVNARINTWGFAVNQGNTSFSSPDSDPAVAVAYFQTASALMPDSMQGPYGQGLSLLRATDYEAAIAPLERAVELGPEDPNTHRYLATAYLQTDRATQAVTALEAAQERFPDDEDIRATRLNAYAIAGDTDKAIAEYEAEIAAGRDNAMVRYNYGSLLLGASRADEAIEQLTVAVEMDGDNPDAQYNLGAALQNQAASLAVQANETEDNDAANALIEERNQLLEQALPYLEASRDLAPEADKANSCSALFQVYTQLNRIDDANAVAECAGMSMN